MMRKAALTGLAIIVIIASLAFTSCTQNTAKKTRQAGQSSSKDNGTTPLHASPQIAPSVVWLTDLASAFEDAAKDHKLLLLYFNNTDSQDCVLLEQEVFTSEVFAAHVAESLLVKLDLPTLSKLTEESLSADPKLAELLELKTHYSIDSFPTVLILSPTGEELLRSDGYQQGTDPTDYLNQLGCQPPMIIAVEDAAAPWSQSDGTGFTNDIVKAAFAAVGISVELNVVPYARAKAMAIAGETVACFSTSPDPALEGLLIFPEQPLFTLFVDYYQNLEHPLSASSADELPKGTQLGVVLDYEYPQAVTDLKQQGVVFAETKDEETNLKKLALGRIDAAVINHNPVKPAEEMISNAGASGKVGFAFRSGEMNSYIVFSQQHPLGAYACRMFDQGYIAIETDGTLEQINTKWIPDSGEAK